jgi:hypothetical protein
MEKNVSKSSQFELAGLDTRPITGKGEVTSFTRREMFEMILEAYPEDVPEMLASYADRSLKMLETLPKGDPRLDAMADEASDYAHLEALWKARQ